MSQSNELISSAFELDTNEFLDEETLVTALSTKIREMLDHEIELLFSTLYRLDIFESKINAVLENPAVPNDIGLAKLVIDRQKEKIESRRRYKSKPMGEEFNDLDF